MSKKLNTREERIRLHRLRRIDLISKGLMAGMLIGLGDITYLTIENKYIGAALFSLGLLTIIKMELYLFTGKIGYINRSINEYILMLVSNYVGASIMFIMGYIASHESLIVPVKFNRSIFEIFIAGVLCGCCMYIAVDAKLHIITIFAIMVFILNGFEHCIADAPYILWNFSLLNCFKYIMIVFGNATGSIIMHLLKTSVNTKENKS